MAKNNIKATITLEDNQIRNSLKVLNSNLKMLDSQLKLNGNNVDELSKDFKKASSTLDTYKSKIEILKQKQQEHIKQIDLEKQKLQANMTERKRLSSEIDNQKKKIEDLSSKYSENSKEVKEAENELKKLHSAFMKNENVIARNNININNLNTSFNKTEAEIGETVNKMNTLNTAFKNSQNSINGLNDDLQDTADTLDDIGNSTTGASNNIGKLGQTLDGVNFNNVVNGIQGGLSSITNGLDRINSVGVGAFKGIIETGATFEVGMTNWKALTGATAEEFKRAEEKARELGATTKYTAKEGADALGFMALAGLDVKTQLGGVDYVLKLANVGSTDLATTSDLLTDSMSALVITSSDSETHLKNMAHYTDILSQAQRNSNATTTDLMEAYIGAGGILADVNTSIEESASLLGTLANAGIKGSEAGSSLNSLLTNLKATTSSSIKGFQQLGIEVYDNAGKFKGYEAVIRDMAKVLPTLNDEQKAFAKTLIGGKTQMDTLNALINAMADGSYDKLKKSIEGANGALNEMNDIMTNNTANDFKSIMSRIDDLKIKAFESLKPLINEMIGFANKFLDALGRLDDGQIKMIGNLLKYSLITGVVLKGLNGVVGMIGNVGGAYIGLNALMGKSTLLFAGAGKAVAGASTAVAGTGTAIAGAGTTLAGFGATLTSFIPHIAVITTALVGLGILIKKGSEDSISNVDNFANATIQGRDKIVAVNDEISNSYKEMNVTISEESKNRLTETMENTDELQKILETGFFNQNNLSREEYDKMKKLQQDFNRGILTDQDTTQKEELRLLEERFNKEKELRSTNKEDMIKVINEDNALVLEKLEEKHSIEIEKTRQFFSDVLNINGEELENKLNQLKEGQALEVEQVNKQHSDLLAKVEEYYGNEQVITKGQTKALYDIISEAEQNNINLLAESSNEALAITQNSNEAQLYATAETMGAEIKALEDARVEKERIAETEYQNRLSTLQQLYYDEGVITDEQYKTALGKIVEDRNNQILEANKTKQEKLSVLEAYNKDVYTSLDKNTGEVRKKYRIWLDDLGEFVRGYNGDNAEASNKAIESIQKVIKETGEIPDYQEKNIEVKVSGWQRFANFISKLNPLGSLNMNFGRSIDDNMISPELLTLNNGINKYNNSYYSEIGILRQEVKTMIKSIDNIPGAVRQAVEGVKINNITGDTNIKLNLNASDFTKSINTGLYMQQKEENIFKGK